MHGELTALLSATCYAVSNLLIRKGQDDTLPSDYGLFPVLLITGVILSITLTIDVSYDRGPLIDKGLAGTMGILFCVLSGLLATLFGRLALYTAISRIGATRGSIIAAMSPLVTLTVALVILRERLTFFDKIGIGVLLVGVFLLLFEQKLFPTRFAPSDVVKSGIAIAVWATLFQGVGYAFRKVGILYPIDSLFAGVVDTWAALILYIVFLSLTGRLVPLLRHYWSHMNLSIVTAGVVMSAAVYLFFEAVSQVPVSTVSVIMGTQPVIVALLAGLFMNKLERLTIATWLSSLIVCVGVILLGI